MAIHSEASILKELQLALARPLEFAFKDDYAHIDRLKDLNAFILSILRSLSAPLSKDISDKLLLLSEQFDQRQGKARISTLIELQQFLSNPAFAKPTCNKALNTSLTVLPKIGPKKAAYLSAAGLKTLGELLNFLPKNYIDRRHPENLDNLVPGQTAVLFARVLRCQFLGRPPKRRLEVLLENKGKFLKLTFFHSSSFHIIERLTPQAEVTVLGTLALNSQLPTMIHPRVFTGEKTEELSGIWPCYTEIAGIPPSEFSRLMLAALNYLEQHPLIDPLPESLLKPHRLAPLETAYVNIHAPFKSSLSLNVELLNQKNTPAFRRIAFEELLTFQLALQQKSLTHSHEKSLSFPLLPAEKVYSPLFPFSPTSAQIKVLQEILQDLSRNQPMARLLQGDVGAGKTAVAAAACFHVAQKNAQCAIMVPTEVLATQHYETFQKTLSPHGITVRLLTGSTPTSQRRTLLQEITSGTCQIVIGTHALISEDVHYHQLALCIVDEQHRFGVKQRTQLQQKGAALHKPHLLVMTATPIPRSLALTLYGDLALSVLNELPPGRKPVATQVLRGDPTQKAMEAITPRLQAGEKIYVIYPLVEESEKLDLLDATTGFEHLKHYFGAKSCGLLHGRMKPKEKELVMQEFVRGPLSILVSTTVIEVGVNVPEATCMVIMHAERFGLSQLHQLRGRVGRGEKPSFCYLITDQAAAKEETYKRLAIMEQSNDGFVISQADLDIRGPGDFLGTRQSGVPIFHACDLTKHGDLVEPARNLAIQILEKDPLLESPFWQAYKKDLTAQVH